MDTWQKKLIGAERRFYSNPKISQANKDYIKGVNSRGGYMQSWNAQPATIAKFYNTIYYFLELTEDAKKDLNDKEKIASIFSQLHKRLGASTYRGVYVEVKKLGKWLNDGTLPKSLEKVNVPQLDKEEKKSLLRANNKNYATLSWDEGLTIISKTNDLMEKAFVMVALEAGMRPNEYYNIDYEDVERQGKFYVIHLEKTKTATPRDVILFKSSPYLSAWLNGHPTKEGALWILKKPKEDTGKPQRYTENASKKLFLRLTEKAKIKKRISLYMLRHSACRIAKKENLNPELASKQFGHSINFYASVYGKTSTEDDINRFKKHYGEKGIDEQKQEDNKPKVCPVCDMVNEHDKTHCIKCNNPLSLTVALKEKENKDSEMKAIQDKMERMEKILFAMQNQDKIDKKKS